jgi:RNA polymerase sigma-70 factor, ECF subfamily
MQEMISITWNHLYDDLVAFVEQKVKDKPTAKDIVQDVFIKVLTKSNQLKAADKIIGWIYQITRNAVADHFRKRSRNFDSINIDWESNYHEFNECVGRCLKSLMDKLPDEYRIPLALTELENQSQHQVAQALNISYSGARSRVQRARKMLKQKLDELYFIETDSYGNIIACEDRDPGCCSRQC